MSISWNKFVLVAVASFQMAIFFHAATGLRPKVEIKSKPKYLNYVRLEETLVLNVTLIFHTECNFYGEDSKNRFIVVWRMNGGGLLAAKRGYESFSKKPRVSIEGEATLVIRNTTLEDNDTLHLQIYCKKDVSYPIVNSSFEVIVQVMPNVFSNCSDMIVHEGDDVTCICTANNGNPPAELSWKGKLEGGVGNSNGILTLQNITKSQNGIYTCLGKSHDLVNKTSFNLRVHSRRILIKYFQIFQGITSPYSKLFIICNAEGAPAPTYVIKRNGTQAKVGNTLIVDQEEFVIPGLYECLARNEHGIARSWLRINKSIQVGQGFEKEDSHDMGSRVKWYITMIAVVFAFIAGGFSLYVVMRLHENVWKKVGHFENSSKDVNSPESHNQQNRNVNGLGTTEYEEVDLIQVNRKQYPKPLGVNSEVMKQLAEKNENAYQELNQFRDNDSDRYQSLIHAQAQVS